MIKIGIDKSWFIFWKWEKSSPFLNTWLHTFSDQIKKEKWKGKVLSRQSVVFVTNDWSSWDLIKQKYAFAFVFVFTQRLVGREKYGIVNPGKDLLIYLFYACVYLYNMTLDLSFLTTLSMGYPRILDFCKFNLVIWILIPRHYTDISFPD